MDSAPLSSRRTGILKRDNGRFGFIETDNPGEADMFVMPAACAAFGNIIPPLGTRVSFEVVPDEKTGKPRASDVMPADGTEVMDAAVTTGFPSPLDPLEEAAQLVLQSFPQTEAMPDLLTGTGTVRKDNGTFGFITVDGQEGNDMFVMPAACTAFGNLIPPMGTRVRFSVVTDSKTGRPRAENVAPVSDDSMAAFASPASADFSATEAALMAEAEAAFQALQTSISPTARANGEVSPAEQLLLDAGLVTGTIKRSDGGFGFIQQDLGGPDIFVLPSSCAAFGNRIPPSGTHVCFEPTVDEKKGLPLASNVAPVGPVDFIGSAVKPTTSPSAMQPPVAMPTGSNFGTIRKDNGKFGFIQHDGGDDMFVMPAACSAFGGVIPPLGTQVYFDIVTDSKTGRPRAENVVPASADSDVQSDAVQQVMAAAQQVLPDMDQSDPLFAALAALVTGPSGQPYAQASDAPASTIEDGERMGTVKRINASFGFIQQDSGGEDMFFMPMACAAFGNVMPPAGTRVLYSVVTDSKTGRPRAENVRIGSGHVAASYGAAEKLDFAAQERSQPY